MSRHAAIALFWLSLLVPAQAAAQNLVTKRSPHEFNQTVERVEAAIKARGATLVAKVDHAAAARANALTLRPTTVLIFGNPKLGTPLMQNRQATGLDLPLRMLVWQDEGGAVQVSYWPPAAIGAMHGVKDGDAVLSAMAGALDAISGAAVAP